MKRCNFKGLWASHGVSVSHRSIDSTGGHQVNFYVFELELLPTLEIGHSRIWPGKNAHPGRRPPRAQLRTATLLFSPVLSQIEANAPNDEKYCLVPKVVHVNIALLVCTRMSGSRESRTCRLRGRAVGLHTLGMSVR